MRNKREKAGTLHLLASYALFAMPTPTLLACILAANGYWSGAVAVGCVTEALGLVALCIACGPTAMRRINESDHGA